VVRDPGPRPLTAGSSSDRPAAAGRLGRGLLAGLLGGLAMSFVIVFLRWAVGVPLVVDLISDRVLPELSVRTFARLLGRVGGPVKGKETAFIVSFGAQIVAAALGGALFAAASGSSGKLLRRRASAVSLAVLGVVWVAFVVLLWPALESNYRGLPPPAARLVTALGLMLAFATYAASVAFVLRPRPASGEAAAWPSRRALLMGGAGAALALATGGLAGLLYRRATFGTFGYDGQQLRGPQTAPITPNERFYVVTKNLVDPDVNASWWRLAIDGAVDRPRSYSLDELRALPSIRQEQTLECISNRVGSGLMSNAVWTGVRLPDLLATAGPISSATRVILHAADGYTHTISVEKAMEPTTLLAHRMNGQPLPGRHGYPVRLLVPGTYGEVHVKWLDRIEFTDRPFEGYYEKQGWKPYFVNTTSRFDTPRSGQRIGSATMIPLAGVAFAGDRGISRVEVTADGGSTWEAATITYAGTRLTWSLWRHEWRAPGPGSFELAVRATDGPGGVQLATDHGAIPAGATGLHRVKVVVEA
jgi:DMSO/TMAO reductase YedYZ molybdopterin-dependent catalytic subunit